SREGALRVGAAPAVDVYDIGTERSGRPVGVGEEARVHLGGKSGERYGEPRRFGPLAQGAVRRAKQAALAAAVAKALQQVEHLPRSAGPLPAGFNVKYPHRGALGSQPWAARRCRAASRTSFGVFSSMLRSLHHPLRLPTSAPFWR